MEIWYASEIRLGNAGLEQRVGKSSWDYHRIGAEHQKRKLQY
jgi:hypothetical protein